MTEPVTPPHALCADALRGAMALVRADGGCIAVLDEHRQVLVVQAERTHPVIESMAGPIESMAGPSVGPGQRSAAGAAVPLGEAAGLAAHQPQPALQSAEPSTMPSPRPPQLRERTYRRGEGFLGLCWQRNEPVVVSGNEHARLTRASQSGARDPSAPWHIAVPIWTPGRLSTIRSNGRLLGVLALLNRDPLLSFSVRDAELLMLHADRVARALVLAKVSTTDDEGGEEQDETDHQPPAQQPRPLRIFISYARVDTALADRLEGDIKRAGLLPWVDRRRLEGGQEWLDGIQRAVEDCDVLVVVLTPQAADSEFVRMEWRHARRMGKRVVPLLFKLPPRMPIDLAALQWVDFQDDYIAGLKDLLSALA